MRFTTFLHQGQPRLGVVSGDAVIDLAAAQPGVPQHLRSALDAGIDLHAAASAAIGSNAPRLPMAGLRFAPLVPEPGKTVCLGLNYFDHAKEGGRDKPEYPWFFLRGKSSLLGHGEPGIAPKVSTRFD